MMDDYGFDQVTFDEMPFEDWISWQEDFAGEDDFLMVLF